MNAKKMPVLIVMAALCWVAATPAPQPTLYLIGDSTVKNGSDKGDADMWDWGHFINNFFDTTRLHVASHAIGGRSSRTFLTEGRWDKIMATLKPGDFVMMQFGHNDASAISDTSQARGSIKGTGNESQEIDNLLTKKQEVVHSYGWYLWKYITDTKAKGATPIVLSPVPRNAWKDGKAIRSGSDYGKWAAEVATAEGAYFIDLNGLVAEKYDALSDSVALQKAYFVKDHTHTNEAGARINATCVVDGLQQLKKMSLS